MIIALVAGIVLVRLDSNDPDLGGGHTLRATRCAHQATRFPTNDHLLWHHTPLIHVHIDRAPTRLWTWRGAWARPPGSSSPCPRCGRPPAHRPACLSLCRVHGRLIVCREGTVVAPFGCFVHATGSRVCQRAACAPRTTNQQEFEKGLKSGEEAAVKAKQELDKKKEKKEE